jgi:hypothetical protein
LHFIWKQLRKESRQWWVGGIVTAVVTPAADSSTKGVVTSGWRVKVETEEWKNDPWLRNLDWSCTPQRFTKKVSQASPAGLCV